MRKLQFIYSSNFTNLSSSNNRSSSRNANNRNNNNTSFFTSNKTDSSAEAASVVSTENKNVGKQEDPTGIINPLSNIINLNNINLNNNKNKLNNLNKNNKFLCQKTDQRNKQTSKSLLFSSSGISNNSNNTNCNINTTTNINDPNTSIKLTTDKRKNRDIFNSTVKKNGTVGRKYKFNNSTALKGSNYVEQEYAISIIENYAREVGISAFNFRTMELFITQFIDNEAYVNSITMINFWRPVELIMNQKSENSCLHLLIKKIFKNCYVGFLPRKNFAEDLGKEIYLQSGVRDLTTEELNTKYVCMASLAGLISYLDQNSNMRLEKEHLNIKFHYIENHLNISFQSTIDLELLLNSKFHKSFGSLFSLFQCQTVSGFRLLRSNILQPLAIKEDINRRYQAVEELLNNPEVLFHIREFLPYFKDLEVNISKFMHKLEEPTESIIKQVLSAIQGIRICLKHLKIFKEIIKYKLKSELFLVISNAFDEKIFEYLLENIENVIEEFDFTNTKITRKQDSIFFMIKACINNVLDVSRKTYSDTINEIYSEFEKLKTSSNDPNVKLFFSESRGYYIVLNEKYFIESEYVVSRKVNKKIHCANIPLISLSERIKEIKRDLVDVSFSLITDLVQMIQKNVNYLYVLSSYIALLDVICAFTDYSKNSKTTKPIINNNKKSPFIVSKNSRHPLYEINVIMNVNSESYNNFFVPNDYFLTSHFNILLLKGANASGKTTYMKQLALNIILAQIGCFVPSDFLEFTLRKFLYTKFDSNDNVEENRGVFVKEIIEIQKVVSNNMNDSLVLLDEPFDNSDSKENLALSVAVLDQFTNIFTRSFIVISSHNNSLSQLASFYFNIVIGTMVVEFTDEALNFLFKFKYDIKIDSDSEDTNNNFQNSNIRDYNKEENYGIILANMIGFEKDVIETAKEISIHSNSKKNLISDFIERSDSVNYFKIFLFKLLYELYELKYVTNCYVIEEEIIMKKREITQFIKNCLN